MMKFTEFLKKEISGWKHYEIIILLLVFLLILYNAVILGDNLIAVFSALCGILYTVIAGKGKISCYFFGLIGSVCYILLAINYKLFGNAALYLLYYIPMQVHGIFAWKKHLNKQSNEIIKTRLSESERQTFILTAITGCIITIFILSFLNDSRPLIDGITTFLSILGMFFTVKRYIEQWNIWIIVNGLSFLMWLSLIFKGGKAYSTLIMWGFYFILAIYFYIVWNKDFKNKKVEI